MFICVLGLFAYSHMEFEVDRDKGQNGDPPLHEMAVKALSILQKNNKGFFLFVESKYILKTHLFNIIIGMFLSVIIIIYTE